MPSVKKCIEINFGVGSHVHQSVHLGKAEIVLEVSPSPSRAYCNFRYWSDRAGLFLEINDLLQEVQVPML